MSSQYPGTIQTFTNPSGTSVVTSPDHAGLHSDLADTSEAVQAVLGTTAGTSVLTDVLEGEFVATTEGTETLTNKTLTSPTINAATMTGTIAYGDNAPNIGVKARAYRATSNQSFGSSPFKVELNAESYDVGGDFDSTTNYRFTAPVTGYYLVIQQISMSVTIASGQYFAEIYKDGALYSRSEVQAAYTSAIHYNRSDLIYLTSTQYVEMFMSFTGASQAIVYGEGETFMAIHLISV